MSNAEESRPQSMPLPVLNEERSFDSPEISSESVTTAPSLVPQTQPVPQQPRARVYQRDVISPLDFKDSAHFAAVLCGVCCICSLPCSIPALILSQKVSLIVIATSDLKYLVH